MYNDLELYDDLLTNKEFNNDNDKLKTSVDYMNSITEILDLDCEILTIEKIKENNERERIERRQEQNEKLSLLIDEIEEDYSSLIEYYYSLNYYQKIEYLTNNDEYLTKILTSETVQNFVSASDS